jgi:signal transduction histidine kinase
MREPAQSDECLAHNGSIDFTSEVGRGTTFQIELPLAASR